MSKRKSDDSTAAAEEVTKKGKPKGDKSKDENDNNDEAEAEADDNTKSPKKKGSSKGKSKSKSKSAAKKKGSKKGKKDDQDSEEKKDVKPARIWKWGIMATGKIAQDFVTSLQPIDEAEVIAVAGRNIESAKAFAERFDIGNAYGSYKELVENKDVEIIYVASTHQAHKENALLAIRAGKHVLCEKAFMTNSAEAAEVIKEANERKVMVLEAMWSRHLPVFVKIREYIEQKKIGDVRRLGCDFGFAATEASAPRLYDPNLCGGALLDVGVYCVSLSSWLFGPAAPSKISARADLTDKKVDSYDVITLEYGPNKTAQLSCAVDRKQACRAVIEGTEGIIIIEGKDNAKDHNPMWHSAQNFMYISKDNKGAPEVVKAPMRTIKNAKWNFKNSQGLGYEAEHMMKCLNEGKTDSPVMSNAETLTIMNIFDEIRTQTGVVYPWEKSAGVPKS